MFCILPDKEILCMRTMTTIIVRGETQAVTVVTYATSQLLWQNLDNAITYD